MDEFYGLIRELLFRQFDIFPFVRFMPQLLFEEIEEGLTRLTAMNPSGSIQSRLPMEIILGSAGPGDDIEFAKDDPSDFVMNHSAGAHGAWFQGRVDSDIGKVEIEALRGEVTQAGHLGVGRDIGEGVTFVMAARHDLPVPDSYGTDRHFSLGESLARFGHSLGHEFLIVCHVESSIALVSLDVTIYCDSRKLSGGHKKTAAVRLLRAFRPTIM